MLFYTKVTYAVVHLKAHSIQNEILKGFLYEFVSKTFWICVYSSAHVPRKLQYRRSNPWCWIPHWFYFVDYRPFAWLCTGHGKWAGLRLREKETQTIGGHQEIWGNRLNNQQEIFMGELGLFTLQNLKAFLKMIQKCQGIFWMFLWQLLMHFTIRLYKWSGKYVCQTCTEIQSCTNRLVGYFYYSSRS